MRRAIRRPTFSVTHRCRCSQRVASRANRQPASPSRHLHRRRAGSRTRSCSTRRCARACWRATEPRDLWVAGQLDTVDPWAQVSALAQARSARADGESLSRLARRSPASRRCSRCRPSATPPIAWPTGRRATTTTACRRCCWPTARAGATTRRRWSRSWRKRRRVRASTTTRIAARCFSGTTVRRSAGHASIPPARAELAGGATARVSVLVRDRRQMQTSCAATPRSCRTTSAVRCATQPERRPRNAPRRGRCASAGRARWPNAARAPAPLQAAATQQLDRRAAPRVRVRRSAATPIAQALESADAAVRARAVAQWEARLVREAQRRRSAPRCESKG